jgi:hypothetical protein
MYRCAHGLDRVAPFAVEVPNEVDRPDLALSIQAGLDRRINVRAI